MRFGLEQPKYEGAVVSGVVMGGAPKLTGMRIKTQKIPLPLLATQQAIVAKFEAEQALVNASRELITRFEK